MSEAQKILNNWETKLMEMNKPLSELNCELRDIQEVVEKLCRAIEGFTCRNFTSRYLGLPQQSACDWYSFLLRGPTFQIEDHMHGT
jgi:hypothetical protein